MSGRMDHTDYLSDAFNDQLPVMNAMLARSFYPSSSSAPSDAYDGLIDRAAQEHYLQEFRDYQELLQSGAPEDLLGLLGGPELNPPSDAFGSSLATFSQHDLPPTTSYVFPTIEDLQRALSSRIREEWQEYERAQARLSPTPSHFTAHRIDHNHNLAFFDPAVFWNEQQEGRIQDSEGENAAENELEVEDEGSEGEGSEGEDEDEEDEGVSDYEESNVKGKRKRGAAPKSSQFAKSTPSAARPTKALPSQKRPIHQPTIKTSPVAAHVQTIKKKRENKRKALPAGHVEGYLCPCYLQGRRDRRCNAIIKALDDVYRHLKRHLLAQQNALKSGTSASSLQFGGYPLTAWDPEPKETKGRKLSARNFECIVCGSFLSRKDALKRHNGDNGCHRPRKTVAESEEASRPPAKKKQRVDRLEDPFEWVTCSEVGACKVTAIVAQPAGPKLRAEQIVSVDKTVPFWTDRFRVRFTAAGQVVRVLRGKEEGGRRMFTPYTPDIPVEAEEEEEGKEREEEDNLEEEEDFEEEAEEEEEWDLEEEGEERDFEKQEDEEELLEVADFDEEDFIWRFNF